ncbi:MAG: phospholipid carrier-dependent glycosyltransferase [Gemmatimonadetes bacterium]|nr:phospholipid carrier-dependent glycosyltransferase [Gemmatimonadota bacterium]
MRLFRSHGVLLAVLCVAAGAQAWISLRNKSLTFDELTYIPAGYSYVVTGDYRINPEHPPLAKLLAGGALLSVGPRLDLLHESWEEADQWVFGEHFFETSGVGTARLTETARAPFVALLMALVLLAYFMATELYSARAGLLAATLCAFSPNLLAHGRLATTDFPQAFMVVATAYAFLLFTRSPSPMKAVATGVALGLALLSKYSAILLVGLLGVWSVAAAVRRIRRRPKWGVADGTLGEAVVKDLPHAARTLGGGLALALIVAALVVSVGYGTPGNPLAFFGGLGVLYTNVHVDLPTYFDGRFHPDGLWYYFVAAFVLKAPTAFLLLLALRIGEQVSRRGVDLDEALYLWLPAVVWVVAMTATALQFGIRYILPVYPLLFIYVSGIAASPFYLGPVRRATVFVLTGLFVVGSLRAHPHYIPFFNALAGGPANGIEWLDDSNVDWGQDLPLLRDWLEANEIDDATLVPMAFYDPALYGVPGTVVPPEVALPVLASPDPEPGIYAVSAHLLTRVRWGGQPAIDPLRDLEPRVVLGHSIWVFDIPPR